MVKYLYKRLRSNNNLFPQSNDNMEMMTNLTSEQHVSKELAGRLSQQEEELKEIREQVISSVKFPFIYE